MMVKSKSKLWHVKLTLKKVINQIVLYPFRYLDLNKITELPEKVFATINGTLAVL